MKIKLKDARRNTRKGEKIIRNLHDDIDNFQSDIRKQQTQIIQLQQTVEELAEENEALKIEGITSNEKNIGIQNLDFVEMDLLDLHGRYQSVLVELDRHYKLVERLYIELSEKETICDSANRESNDKDVIILKLKQTIEGMKSDGEGKKASETNKGDIDILKLELKTADTQIEKDWTIIERQSQQIEIIHQQYIEQRDLNSQCHSELVEISMRLENATKNEKDCEKKMKEMKENYENQLLDLTQIKEMASSKGKEHGHNIPLQIIESRREEFAINASKIQNITQTSGESSAETITIKQEILSFQNVILEIKDDLQWIVQVIFGKRIEEKDCNNESMAMQISTLKSFTSQLRSESYKIAKYLQNEIEKNVRKDNLRALLFKTKALSKELINTKVEYNDYEKEFQTFLTKTKAQIQYKISNFLKTNAISPLDTYSRATGTEILEGTLTKVTEDLKRAHQLNKLLEENLSEAKEKITAKEAMHKREVNLVIKGIKRRDYEKRKKENGSNGGAIADREKDNLLENVTTPADFLQKYLASRGSWGARVRKSDTSVR